MELNFTKENKNLVVKIEGDIDHHTSAEIKDKIDKQIERAIAKNLIFDFDKVNFMDSSGIGMIIGRYKIIEKLGGKVAIINPSDNILRIINISGLHKIACLFNTTIEALEDLK